MNICQMCPAFSDTLVSTPTPLTNGKRLGRKYAALFGTIAMCSAALVYNYLLNSNDNMTLAKCVETIYVLQVGQSATCKDARSKLHIENHQTTDNIVVICKCS